MDQAPRMAFSHIGLYVADIATMVSFYTGVLGFSITDQAHIRGADVVFLSRDPDEHHQIVLVPGRGPQSPSTVNQVSFRVVSLPELRRLHAQLVALEVPGLNPTNHGGSWSVYFLDPEGNRIELFAQTPWYMPPVSVPLDFALSDDEIYEVTHAMVRATPGSMKRAEWRSRLEERLRQEGTIEHRTALTDESSPSGAHSPGGSMHKSRLSNIIIDCQTDDIDAAAGFWAAAIGRVAESDADPAEPYRLLEGPRNEMKILVQAVRHESRVHLDIETNDVEAEASRLERLGARRVAKIKTWWVMEAPTGQRFCVVRPQRADFEENANTWRGEGDA